MTDDPFLPKPQGEMRPAEPIAQPAQYPPAPPQYEPAPPYASAPAQYQPAQYQPAQYQPPQYAQAGYPPPPPMPYYQGQPKPKTWMNWVALGCGLAVFVTCISGIAAIVFGHLGLAAAKRGEADARAAGIAGLVLGYLSVVGIVAYIAFIAMVIGSGFSEY